MIDREWLDNLTSGNEVVISNRMNKIIVRVERTTKTLVVLKNGGRYRKSNGFRIGSDNWNTSMLIEITDKIRESFRRNNLKHFINDYDFGKLKTETLEKIKEVICND